MSVRSENNNEVHFQAIIEAIPSPLALNDAQGSILYLNRAFIETIGYTLDEIPDLASWWPRAYPDPQYRQWVADKWKESMEAARLSGQPFAPLEVDITCKDGKVGTFLVSPTALGKSFDGIHLVTLFDITQRKRMEERSQFQKIALDRAGEEIFLIDEAGHILDANETACRKLGYSMEEFCRMSVSDVNPFFPFENWAQHWQTLKREKVLNFESRHQCRDGRIFPTEVVANYFEYEGAEYNCALVRDITERKLSEARIEHLVRLYRALSEVNQAIVRMEDESALFPLVCKMAVDFGGLKMAWIGRLEEKSGLIQPSVCYGSGSDYLKTATMSVNASLPEGQGPAGTAFRENRIVIVNRFQENAMTKPWHQQARRFGWNSSGTFPVVRGGKPYALLGVYHNHEEAFDEETIALLDEMVRDVSFALDRFDQERVRLKAEEDLLSSERHFRAYFERSMVGMAATSPEKEWLEVNDALCEMLDYSPEELMGMTWSEITFPEDLAANEEMFARILSGEISEYEMDKRFIRKNGEITYAHIAVRAVYKDRGEVDYLVVLVDDITSTRNQQRQLELLVHHDTLTGLPNRALFNDRLEMALAKARRSEGKLAVCFMDLDGFKPVNDTFGHATGDLLLVEVAKRMLAISRASDTVARLGGDEFVLIFSDISDESECRQLLMRFMGSIGKSFSIGGHEIQVSASIGVAIYPDDDADGDSLLRHADQAMYIAKQAGRNRIHFFDVLNDQLVQVRSEGRSRVELALKSNEFTLHYQPKVNMLSGKVIGVEALIRWTHPERGLLPPIEFLPLIENSEFEVRLSEWVVTEAMRQLEAWRKEGLNLTVSVNIPARHLQSEGFVDFMASIIARYPEAGSGLLELEILETAAFGDMSSVIRKMEACIELGLRFSIDDFGTGYASLAYLRRLPADIIKIDQLFVVDMLHDMNDLSIVKGVIGLAEAFQKEVIAEGVETKEHGVRLLEMGCEFAQGYGIARPMEPQDVAEWVRNFRTPVEWTIEGFNNKH